MKVLIAFYSHPEGFPPSLNAIQILAGRMKEVSILYQNRGNDRWKYPDNVVLHKIGRQISFRKIEKASVFRKAYELILYSFNFLRLLYKLKPDIILLYDPIPLFVLTVLRPFISRKPVIWYHNHDVYDKSSRTIMGKATSFFQKRSFRHINLFSLPSPDRLNYFPPLDKYPGIKFHQIPNYPSLALNTSFYRSDNKIFRNSILYQGWVSNGHGFEELNNYITGKDKELKVYLYGTVDSRFRSVLQQLDSFCLKGDGSLSYRQILDTIPDGSIGWAVNIPHNNQYKTGGLASNKIYEYAAKGLPVIVYDSENYRKYLEKYDWVFFTDLSSSSLEAIFREIKENYLFLSSRAREAFKTELNYEKVFSPALESILTD
jgi:hypothetical protein